MMNKLYKIAKIRPVQIDIGGMVVNTRTALNKDEILGPWKVITEVDGVTYLLRRGTALVRQDEKILFYDSEKTSTCWGEMELRESKKRFADGRESSCDLSFTVTPNTIREE